MRRFIIDPTEIQKTSPAIRGQDALHIRKVLRLSPGEGIFVLDGHGNEYEAVIQEIHDDHVSIQIIKQTISQTESPLQIAVYQSFLKEKKMDVLVRMLTEIGISAWIPVFSHRSVPRPDEKRQMQRLERWKEIALQSIKQCRRAAPPEILPPIPFDQVVFDSKGADLKLIFYENASQSLKAFIAPEIKKPSKIVLLLGPEGGFTQKENDSAITAGFTSVSLGPRILRAETAAVAACVIIQHLFGDLG